MNDKLKRDTNFNVDKTFSIAISIIKDEISRLKQYPNEVSLQLIAIIHKFTKIKPEVFW